ncbi:MAG TPA: hypothetical protein VJ565_03885, partial [Dehalococcoidia bacterium]|nr:hypothetical protein [Dehalococcoidia bacterium]
MRLLAGIQELIGRPVRDKFRSAIPSYPGDRLLIAVLGKVLSQPGLARRAFGEGEIFLIKGALFLSGVRLDVSAYKGIGTLWKEDLGQRHYDPDAGRPQGRSVPHALHLPHGFYVPIYIHPGAPLLLRREGGTLYLYLEGMRLFPVEFERRPAYYSEDTTTGVPMRLIGPHRLERQVMVEYNAYCRFFSEKKACLFCGIVGERPLLPGRYKSYFAASPTEVAETVEAAYGE